MKTLGFICRVPGRDTHLLTRPGNARSGITCDASPSKARIASVNASNASDALRPPRGQANSAFIHVHTPGSQRSLGINCY